MRTLESILVGISQAKKSPGRPSCRWEEKKKIKISKIFCESVEWMQLA
jgi:hypothetical protein